MKMHKVIGLAFGVVVMAFGGAAFADDHLFSAATSEGAGTRDFNNPVAGNPSGTSGAQAQPGSVPGLCDPKAGADTGTPSFSAETLSDRLDAKKPN
ncbi:MAG: hypothetical protein IMF05_10565 [Proteobacteria bacterium]|nr:hypothetical protein [Pseudomonadota bacterium]